MLKFTSMSDAQLSSLAPPHRQTATNALQTLHSILGPDLTDRGFVVFVEENDTLDDVNHACNRNIETSLEGTFLDDNCLIGVVLWGNSGEGVTIVCPNVDGYAEEVAEVLRKHL
ncbi:MAG: hypothetical protein QNK27_06820 [Desulfuromusa sp.]|nr:hypothetical protein [Desulfuromusa sp.]